MRTDQHASANITRECSPDACYERKDSEMSPELAEEIISEIEKINPIMSTISELIERIEDVEEKRIIRRNFAEVSLQIGERLAMPISDKFAHLSNFNPLRR